jgi:nucleotide-binding universal stress UspA family protein
MVLGSVAEIIVRQSFCPVLTVGPSDLRRLRQFGPRSILFANDSSAPAKLAQSLCGVGCQKMGFLADDAMSWKRNQDAFSQKSLKLNAAAPKLKDVTLDAARQTTLQSSSGIGTRSDLILQVAHETSADLIVLAVSEVYSFDRFRSSYGYRVVCGAPCPVLTVRDEELSS